MTDCPDVDTLVRRIEKAMWSPRVTITGDSHPDYAPGHAALSDLAARARRVAELEADMRRAARDLIYYRERVTELEAALRNSSVTRYGTRELPAWFVDQLLSGDAGGA